MKSDFLLMLLMCVVAALAIFAIYLVFGGVPANVGLLDWWKR